NTPRPPMEGRAGSRAATLSPDCWGMEARHQTRRPMAPMPHIPRDAALTLPPLALMLLGAAGGGEEAGVAALLWLALAGALARPALAREAGDTRLPIALAAGHLLGLPLVLVALAGQGPGAPLDLSGRVVLGLALAAYVLQASLPAAHALIHAADWRRRWLGAMVLTSLGFGHFASAHLPVHHRHVGTHGDPHTPLPGEGFWTYLRRAWAEGFRAGQAAEAEKLAARGIGPCNWRNPCWLWLGGEVTLLAGAALIAGPVGLLAHLGLWLLAGAAVLMADYLRHYGLRRCDLPSGGREPVGPQHRWAAPGEPGDAAPRLPLPLPSMALLAMVPPLWARVMDPRAARAMDAAAARIAAWNAAREPESPAMTIPVAKAAPEAGPEEAADEDMARAMDAWAEAGAEEEADGALLARVQDLVNEERAVEPEPDGAPPRAVPAPLCVQRATGRVKLSRPIRTSRRAALRDR
ncbi:MAG: hypothetical protein ACOCY0_05830, partial [Roseicyclus sp.]